MRVNNGDDFNSEPHCDLNLFLYIHWRQFVHTKISFTCGQQTAPVFHPWTDLLLIINVWGPRCLNAGCTTKDPIVDFWTKLFNGCECEWKKNTYFGCIWRSPLWAKLANIEHVGPPTLSLRRCSLWYRCADVAYWRHGLSLSLPLHTTIDTFSMNELRKQEAINIGAMSLALVTIDASRVHLRQRTVLVSVQSRMQMGFSHCDFSIYKNRLLASIQTKSHATQNLTTLFGLDQIHRSDLFWANVATWTR